MAIIGIASITNQINGISNLRLPENYVKVIREAQAIPVVIPIISDDSYLEQVLSIIDGLLIPGGGDVNPKFYNEDLHPLTNEPDTRLDCFQLKLLKKALERNLPVLGICRGHQLLNVACGGTLYQDISLFETPNPICHDQTKLGIPYHETCHEVVFKENTILEKLFGPIISVNSFHHQAVKALGKGVVPIAYSIDGLVEAVIVPEYEFVLSVQWHPERTENQMPLIKYFVDEVKRIKKGR